MISQAFPVSFVREPREGDSMLFMMGNQFEPSFRLLCPFIVFRTQGQQLRALQVSVNVFWEGILTKVQEKFAANVKSLASPAAYYRRFLLLAPSW